MERKVRFKEMRIVKHDEDFAMVVVNELIRMLITMKNVSDPIGGIFQFVWIHAYLYILGVAA